MRNQGQRERLNTYLHHIRQAIDRIQEYTSEITESDFLRDHRTQDAVIRNLEIIGKACRNVATRYPEFAENHPEVPWSAAYEMRNVLAHGYFSVDLAIVWHTIERDLPGMKTAIVRLLDRLSDPSMPGREE